MAIRSLLRLWALVAAVVMLQACGGGGGSGGSAGECLFGSACTGGTPDPAAALPTLALTLSSSSIRTGAPATVTATLRDASGSVLEGRIVTFQVERGLGVTNVATALTDGNGRAAVILSPASNISAGADEVTATAVVAGTTYGGTVAFQVVGSPLPAPTLSLELSSSSVSLAAPATVTARLLDATGEPVAGQVVSFAVERGLGVTNVATALTDGNGRAAAILSPASNASAGADEVAASASLGGTVYRSAVGFQLNATPVSVGFADSPPGLLANEFTLSAFGQAVFQLNITGASPVAPVNITLSSACTALGRARLEPAVVTATGAVQSVFFVDQGCGALQVSDEIRATVAGSSSTASVAFGIGRPDVSSLAFVRAEPEQIYLRGSGLAETSIVTFQVRDASGQPLANEMVTLSLATGAGGVLLEGRTVADEPVTVTSGTGGEVSVRINAGTVPTPVRVQARVGEGASEVSTVSSNLSVAVGLPSQRNFSLSQATRNIEGFNIDGVSNTYSVIVSDSSGNPVTAGTTINFITEGGQVQQSAQVQLINGMARASAAFVSADPRPADGRITVTAYALGEEAFIDLNGNNVWDALPVPEPFRDLGDVFKDHNFNGFVDPGEEVISLGIGAVSSCVIPSNLTYAALLALGTDEPSVPATCDGTWTPRQYVRKSTLTVLSTSAARSLWASVKGAGEGSGLSNQCEVNNSSVTLVTSLSTLSNFVRVNGQTWYTDGNRGSIGLIAADANGVRLNPLAAGTTVEALSTTPGLTVELVGGSPIPSTTEATQVVLAVDFTDVTLNAGQGLITVRFTSPSGVVTAQSFTVSNQSRPSACVVAP